MNDMLLAIRNGVVEGERKAVPDKIREAMDANVAPQAILDVMTQAMTEVGNLFEAGEYFVPEMLIAARTMQDGMQILKPRLVETDAGSAGIVVAGTVHGDLHEIGKNLVCMMLDCAGFTVIDLGMDVAPERFVQAVKEHRPDILALSALLTTTMSHMNATIEALREASLRQSVKVMIGGAPVTEAYAEHATADGYARDASQAVKMARSFLTVR
jgi:5-methyltetrahydrofolate--homocysteine methyltransferase